MEFKPRAIFLDMDGTILNHQNVVSIHTKEIIDALRIQGYYVFIATGRAFDEIEPMVPPGFQVDGVVTSNGMAGYVDGEIIFKHTLPLNLVETIIKKAREHMVYYELFPYGTPRVTLKQDQVYVEDEIRDPKPDSVGLNEWLSRKQALKEEIAWKDHLEGNEYSKFYFFARTIEHINSWKKVLEQLKKEIDFTMSISSEHNVEVMVANVNKATGVQQMLKHFGLSVHETLAIGDSDNDLPMLKLVNYAVAMKNAPDRIKEIANDVTDFTCDEDGVYYYLKSQFELSTSNK
ncbi:HAD family hydrolase [Neobacillus sp. MM2021_6]|uniref:HAD family hydrolase n=1 Tax=Bacillaceae TaxID=186817 RepID=UPI001409B5B5|nr:MULTISPECIES: HAD family hydrolase [Bacillaceae]MBO0961703.1 HAD family hydrolase [Neobacillus sp. MM2021_6]NHC18294.1 HAD family hydrolase [Bacillus sp. MM2020_4]